MPNYLKHLVFWITLFLLWTYMKSNGGSLKIPALINLTTVPGFMLTYYSLRYVQIPHFYERGKIFVFILSLILSSIVILGIWTLATRGLEALSGHRLMRNPMTIGAYLMEGVQFYSPSVALIAWETISGRRKELERIEALEQEKIAHELNFLKAQLNPHFLFNTLNNLYSYVVNKSPKAPDMILQLSGILDYALYKSQQGKVLLRDELHTIENFLALEKIRYGERLQVTYQKSGQDALPISPLLLLSLIENAFKHGVSGDIDTPRIEINIETVDSVVLCRVWNTKRQHQGEVNDSYKKGIGLSNIKRQLNLTYPNQHKLLVVENEDSFEVSLSINAKDEE